MTRSTRAGRVRPTGSRRGSLLLAFLLGSGAALLALIGVYAATRPVEIAPLAEPVAPRYPDLTMGPLEDVTVGIRPDGTLSVRFPATIANVGDGDFLVYATRPHPLSDEWAVVQRIPDQRDRFTQRETPATLVWGGDGHDHWHVRHVEAHRVETMDGEVLGEVVKAGFCFFDTDHLEPTLAGSPDEHVYSAVGCGGQLDTDVDMGLSVGWGDKYPWQMLDQTVHVPELADGHYIIRMVADPFGWFVESDETNNEVATEISVGTGADGVRTVEVVGELR